MVRNIFWGGYQLSLFIIPKDLEILFDIFCICAFQVICWSMVNPRKLKPSTLIKGSPFNPNIGIWLIISRWWLWNTMYFVFLTLVIIYSIQANFIYPSVHCLLLVKGILFYLEQNELVKFISSAKRISWKCLQALWMSSIYIMNSKGPRMDPCGTPVVTDSILECIPSKLTYWALFVK